MLSSQKTPVQGKPLHATETSKHQSSSHGDIQIPPLHSFLDQEGRLKSPLLTPSRPPPPYSSFQQYVHPLYTLVSKTICLISMPCPWGIVGFVVGGPLWASSRIVTLQPLIHQLTACLSTALTGRLQYQPCPPCLSESSSHPFIFSTALPSA